MEPVRIIDLFSGCGGFSLGAHQAGLRVIAAFDNDPVLASSFPINFPDAKVHVIDVAELKGQELRAEAGRIDGVVGGPPCQGFSAIGKRIPGDPRRQLLQEFFRVVKEVRPTFFVMENVGGLAYADARGELDAALMLVCDNYDCLGPVTLNAAEFGAATERSRLFVVGTHKDECDAVTLADLNVERRPRETVRSAISDLEGSLFAGDRDGFDVWKIPVEHETPDYAKALRATDNCFTGHRTTHHCLRVLRRFSEIPQGGLDKIGRHRRLSWTGQCPALRAGTGPDRGSYQSVRPIHPEHDRVITVREAARLQGFPDYHLFHPTAWHSFRMIGNSVSPFVAQAIFKVLAGRLGYEETETAVAG